MLRYLLLVIFLTSLLSASDATRKQYLELIQQHPTLVHPLGDASKGEIEIILDEAKMASIEQRTGRDVGVVARDRYWIWINDACIFPSGHEGVYGRILWVNGLDSFPGAVVMPITADRKVVLNCNFRHSTRSWEIELPRGACNPQESVENAARREALEETGMVVEDLCLLGTIPPDTGFTGTLAPVFVAKVKLEKERQQEESEAIEEIFSLSLDDIKKAFAQGYHICTIRGQEQQVFFRDPFLAYAILLYELRQHP